MSSQRPFGRRPSPSAPRAAVARPPLPVERAVDDVRVVAALLEAKGAGADLDRELEEWKADRKVRKRSFREPWRSVSIAAAIGFGAGSWLLPDDISMIAQLVTAGLGLASFAAGYRPRRPG